MWSTQVIPTGCSAHNHDICVYPLLSYVPAGYRNDVMQKVTLHDIYIYMLCLSMLISDHKEVSYQQHVRITPHTTN